MPARKLLQRMVEHIRPALEDVGDYDMVKAELARLDDEGNGAMRQRRAWRRNHDVKDVIAELAGATLS
jgi:carboxylate-amine ligase